MTNIYSRVLSSWIFEYLNRWFIMQDANGMVRFMVSTWNEFITRDNNRLYADERFMYRCSSYWTVLPLYWSVSRTNHSHQWIGKYFPWLNRSTRCTRCLRFIQRHVNLLQYRESSLIISKSNNVQCLFYRVGECNDADDLLNITSCPNMIAPDAVLYTLHRSTLNYY